MEEARKREQQRAAKRRRTINGIRRRWGDFDTTFLGIIVISVAVHVVGLCHALSLPPPEEPRLESLVGRAFVRAPAVPKPAEPAPTLTPKPDMPAAAPSAPPRPRAGPDKPAPRRVSVKDSPLFRLLGTRLGNNPNSQTAQVLSSFRAGDLDQATRIRPSDISRATASLRGMAEGVEGGGLVLEGAVSSVAERGAVRTERRVANKPHPELITETLEAPPEAAPGLETALGRYRGSIMACYESALKLNPTLRGKYYVDLTVQPTGRISQISVRASKSTVDEGFQKCLLGRATSWKLKWESQSAVDITLPVILTPQQ